jgi:hypothetical protein
MQSRKAVGPDLSALEITPLPSDRFVYQSRFVPFIIRDANGNPILSVIQQTFQGLNQQSGARTYGAMETDVKANKPPKTTKPPKPPKKGSSTIMVGTTTNGGKGTKGTTMGGGVSRPGDDLELGQSASDFGVILLERTRVTPKGFALGEHLLSLSLAPGEEVTIEQKTFSERATTFEEVSDTDEEVTAELGSTYTTEMSEALSRVMSDAKNRGFNAGGNFGFNYVVNLTVSAGYTDSINSAMTSTQGETVRNVMTKTEKLTSRRRAQHKVTMKVSETNRFESGNKRVIRNPNQYTPIDLVYFKLMQKLDMAHERYGVRLCWAPFIPDPGAVLDHAEFSERQRLEREIPLNLPVLRPMPLPPNAPSPEVVSSQTQELTSWGMPWGDMRADYWFEVLPSSAGYSWDGATPSIAVSTTGFGLRGAPNVFFVLIEPFLHADTGKRGARALVHAGADWGGAGAHLYIEFKLTFNPDGTSTNAAYQQSLAAWQDEKRAHDTEVARLTAERNAKVEAALAEWRVEYLKTFDPISSAYQLLIAKLFPQQDMRDSGFEVEMWNKIFDFEAAAFQYYPAWWSNRQLRRRDKPADAFENASWMRVFLPIRPGFEQQALNLVLDLRVFSTTQDPIKKAAVKKVLTDLEAARNTYFGGVDEIRLTPGTPCPTVTRPYICLAHWDELLPTDGTHLEVVQAKTTAVDDISDQAVTDAHQLMNARIGNQTSEGELTATVKDKVSNATDAPDVDVHIGIGMKRDE